MCNEKITILYERLSREDVRDDESLSIEYQKHFLENYATSHGFSSFIHLTDDGWSGTRWDRPGFLKMMELVEAGKVSVILTKDMSRLGRDHLRVGLFLEQLREQGVRLIAPGDNVDTAQGEDDFMPFRNIIAEWYARDTSRKIRTIFGARTAAGKRVSGAIPYGYLHAPHDRQQWIVDEVAAPIVKRIYRSIIEGKTMAQIAEELTSEGVLSPAAHWANIGAGMKKSHNHNPTLWSIPTIVQILKKEEYMGWKVLNKTRKENYKSKKRIPVPPEERLIFKDAHPAIIDEETWHIVQRLRTTKRQRQKTGESPNPLTGILYCADCGQKMYHKKGSTGRPGKPHHEYICSSYRHYSRSCTCHYIRVDVVENLILTAIRKICKFALENEKEFLDCILEKSSSHQEAVMKANRKKVTKAKRRRDEISGLIKKLYESYATGTLPENHFSALLGNYDAEQQELDKEIAVLQAAIDAYNSDSIRTDKFLQLAKRHTDFTVLSPILLNEFSVY
ncbi:MAG: recombinase family protein [Christensenellales bacterium]|jgi:site-specific DNA recombinase